MKKIHVNKILAAGVLALFAGSPSACTWVKPTPAGEFVRVAYADAVVACTRKGNVKVSLKDKVAGVGRKAEKVKCRVVGPCPQRRRYDGRGHRGG